MPDMRPRKFSAMRSPVSSARAGPRTSASTVRFATREPSKTCAVKLTRSSSSYHTASAMPSPATTPSCLAMIRPPSNAFAGTMLSVVTSPLPMSSASARRIESMISTGRTACFSGFLSKEYFKPLVDREQNIASVLGLIAGIVGGDDAKDVIPGRELRRVPRAWFGAPVAHDVSDFVQEACARAAVDRDAALIRVGDRKSVAIRRQGFERDVDPRRFETGRGAAVSFQDLVAEAIQTKPAAVRVEVRAIESIDHDT